ncbi:MAG TPA: GIY-YIG nuclease family protein, partial [Bryobacteraceae bacterium]|nr:GIY-YIG nuclease family protein [Bryobacteraceae bacterium]
MLIEPTRDFEIIRMWPRAMFQKKENGRLLIKQFVRQLELPGVYMLYRGDNLYYIGKATKDLFGRLHSHANKSTDTYYAHWDHFSAFAFTGT